MTEDELRKIFVQQMGFDHLVSVTWDAVKDSVTRPVAEDATDEEFERWATYTRKLKNETPTMDWRSYERVNRPYFIEILPGVRTKRLDWWLFLDDMARNLPEVAPMSDKNEFGTPVFPGITTDWSAVRTVMSLKPEPAGTPPDKTSFFKAASIYDAMQEYPMISDHLEQVRKGYFETVDLDPTGIMIVDDVMDVMFRGLAPTSIKIPKHSQLAFPDFTKDPARKRERVQDWVDNGHEYMKLVEQRDVEGLARLNQHLLYTAGWRIQAEATKWVDGVLTGKKDREAYNYAGKWKSVDRSMYRQINWDQVFAEHSGWDREEVLEAASKVLTGRSRVVNQAPPGPTMPIRAVAHAHQDDLRERYRHTVYFGGIEDFKTKIANATFLLMWDVANHDWAAPWQLLVAIRKAYARLTGPKYEILLELLDRCPSLVTRDELWEKEALVRGDIFDIGTFEDERDNHNKSGRPDTSKVALVLNIFYIFSALYYLSLTTARALGQSYERMFEDLGLLDPRALIPENVRIRRHEWIRYLEGDKALKFSMTGDNALVWSTTYLAAFAVMHLRSSNPYSHLGYTETYNGLTPAITTSGWVVLRDLSTLILRLFQHDRAIGDPRRGSLQSSVPDRKDLFESHPLYDPVTELRDLKLNQYFGRDLWEFAMMDPLKIPDEIDLTNPISREVYDDFTKAMWKYQDSQIDPRLLEMHYLRITYDDSVRLLDVASS